MIAATASVTSSCVAPGGIAAAAPSRAALAGVLHVEVVAVLDRPEDEQEQEREDERRLEDFRAAPAGERAWRAASVQMRAFAHGIPPVPRTTETTSTAAVPSSTGTAYGS